MKKRFTDIDKWKTCFFQKLSVEAKLTWLYLNDNCDHRGVWIENYKLMSFQLGFSVSFKDIQNWFNDEIVRYKIEELYLINFIEFQYVALKDGNNAHKGCIKLLNELESLGFKSFYSNKKNEGLVFPSPGVQEVDQSLDSFNLRANLVPQIRGLQNINIESSCDVVDVKCERVRQESINSSELCDARFNPDYGLIRDFLIKNELHSLRVHTADLIKFYGNFDVFRNRVEEISSNEKFSDLERPKSYVQVTIKRDLGILPERQSVQNV